MNVTIKKDEDASRFLVYVEDDEAGFSEYVRQGDRWVFTHTVVRPEFAGQGLAGRLVKYALTSVIEDGGTIVPTCPYVAAFIQKNPEFQEHTQGFPTR